MDESFGPAATGAPEPAIPPSRLPGTDDAGTVTAVRSPVASRLGGPIPWAILASIALLLASLTIALVVVPPEVDGGSDSAAATVRAYSAAVIGGRYAEAYALLGARGRSGMTLDDFSYMGPSDGMGEQRLDVVGASENGTRATVRARLTMTYAGIEDGQDVRIDLVRVDGRWLIDTPMYGLMPEPEF